MGKTCWCYANGHKIYVYENILSPGAYLLCPGAISYMYMDHNIQTSSSLKSLDHPKEEGTKVCINGPGHMTKMAAMAINSQNLLKIFFSRIRKTWHEASDNEVLQSLYKL